MIKRQYVLGFALAGLLLVGAGCSSKTTNTGSTSGTSVSITSGQAFSPSTLTVAKGTTVTWTNNSSVAHTITGNTGGPSSGQLGQGKTYSYTFDTAGTFGYHCSNHPGMTGTVMVTP